MKAKELLEKIYKEHNLEREDLYVDKRGFVIIKRTGIEKIQFQNNITAKFDVLKCDKRVLGRAVLKLCRIYEDGEVFSSDEIENQPPNTLN